MGEFFGSTFLNSLNYENKDRILFYFDNDIMDGGFTTSTLNYIMPGLFNLSGGVEKEMNLTVALDEIYNWKVFPEYEAINTYANATAKFWIKDHYLEPQSDDPITMYDFLLAEFYIHDMNITWDIGMGRENVSNWTGVNDTYYPKVTMFPRFKNFSCEYIH